MATGETCINNGCSACCIEVRIFLSLKEVKFLRDNGTALVAPHDILMDYQIIYEVVIKLTMTWMADVVFYHLITYVLHTTLIDQMDVNLLLHAQRIAII